MKKSNVMRILSAALVFVMVFGVLVFVSPTEAQAISLNATDKGFYNVAYGAAGETTFGAGAQIRVINATRGGKNKSDAVYKFDGGMSWEPVDENYVVWDGITDNTFYGVYPVADYSAYDSFTIPNDQSGGVQDADWMTDDFTANKSIGKVQFDFQHRLAKVTVTITKWNSEFDGAEKVISTPKIYSKGTALTATYGDSGVTITTSGNDTEINPLVDGTSYTAIVAPAKYSATDKFMTFTVNGQEMTVLANVSELTAGLQPGKHYTFNLTVGKDAVSIASVTVAGWTDREINGVESDELLVFTNREGKVSNVTISAGASAQDVKNAIGEELTSGMTTLMIEGVPTEAQQEAIAEALTEKTDVDLIMGEVTNPVSAITALTNIDLAYQNGAGENGYAVADDGTYVITAKSGLDAWRTAAASDKSANLTLACDVEYNAIWSQLNITYNGTIDGNGYAIKGLNCLATERAFFIGTLGTNGVIKHLGMVDGSFSISVYKLGAGASAFVRNNSGVIMGCYNTSSCTCAGESDDYGAAAGFSYSNNGKIIACYNAGTMSANSDYSAGISGKNSGVISGCYNTGAVSGKGASKGYIASAITLDNSKTINDCYYNRPSTGYENVGGTARNITMVSGSTDWTDAMNAMNTAIEEYNETATVKCNYRYVLNTDAATKDAQPLVIVEVES